MSPLLMPQVPGLRCTHLCTSGVRAQCPDSGVTQLIFAKFEHNPLPRPLPPYAPATLYNQKLCAFSHFHAFICVLLASDSLPHLLFFRNYQVFQAAPAPCPLSTLSQHLLLPQRLDCVVLQLFAHAFSCTWNGGALRAKVFTFPTLDTVLPNS